MSKILYAASTASHISKFHIPYIERLRSEGHTVMTMGAGEDADFNIPFVKKTLSFKNLSCRKRIKKILEAEKFDAIVLNTTLAAFYIRLAIPKKNRPRVVNIVHGYLFKSDGGGLKKRLYLFCERLLCKKTDTVLVMNEDDMKIATENSLAAGEVKMTRGMGAHVSEQKTPIEDIRRYLAAENKYLMCFVGDLSEGKNQRFLICALPEIRIDVPNAALVLVGSGEEEIALRELADKLNVSDSVYFAGQRSNPCDFIRASDLYVSASLKEGLPFNILEALGCGKTVIASDVKGQRDIIENGRDGYLYEVGNMSEFISLVKSARSGERIISEDAAIEKYRKYSFDVVFEDTYEKIKEAIK